MIIKETQLVDYGICPLYDRKEEGNLEKAAADTLRFILLRIFKGIHDRPTVAFIREKYVDIWNNYWFGDQPKVIPNSGPYWEGPKRAATVGRKIYELISRYTVIHPEQPYNLLLNGYTIQGQYALLCRNGENGYPYILVTHSQDYRHKIYPDLMSLARFIHVKMTHQYMIVNILHFPLLRSKPWKHSNIDEKIATKWVSNVLSLIYKDEKFPTLGPHCSTCLSKSCLKVFDGR